MELVPTLYLNVLTIEIKHRRVFRCDIRNLGFNIPYEDDVIAKRLVENVEEAKERIYSDENIPKYNLHQAPPPGAKTRDILGSDIHLLYEITPAVKQHTTERHHGF